MACRLSGSDQITEGMCTNVNPAFLGLGLTLGTMPVAAGVVDITAGPAVFTGLQVSTQRRSATGANRPAHFALGRRKAELLGAGVEVSRYHLRQRRPSRRCRHALGLFGPQQVQCRGVPLQMRLGQVQVSLCRRQ